MSHSVSIIICTYNRADDLAQTLAALALIDVPTYLPTELIVVDNGSTDETRRVACEFQPTSMTVRYVLEPRRGQCYARNTGLAEAKGEIILFTDDDVRPPRNWIVGMCEPILSGRAHAVAGSIRLAPHLKRDWMQTLHFGYLADVACEPGRHSWMVGANMAFSKTVLNKVVAFDPQLGPGALGFGDDTLFSFQVSAAGYKIEGVSISVEHYPQYLRLTRQQFIDSAAKRGRTGAYFTYHWLHGRVNAPLIREVIHIIKLLSKRTLKFREWQYEDGAPVWELELVQEIYFFRQYRFERKLPRNYDQGGLIKRFGVLPDIHHYHCLQDNVVSPPDSSQ